MSSANQQEEVTMNSPETPNNYGNQQVLSPEEKEITFPHQQQDVPLIHSSPSGQLVNNHCPDPNQDAASEMESMMKSMKELIEKFQTMQSRSASSGRSVRPNDLVPVDDFIGDPLPSYYSSRRDPEASRNTAKVAPPQKFKGDMTIFSSKFQDVTSWKREMESYLISSNVPADKQTMYAASYLEDHAKNWWNNAALENIHRSNMPLSQFFELLIKRFKPIRVEERARVALDRLRMSGSCTDYVTSYLLAVEKLPLETDSQKQHWFNQGLPFRLQEKLSEQTFEDVHEMIEYALKHDQLFQTNARSRVGSNVPNRQGQGQAGRFQPRNNFQNRNGFQRYGQQGMSSQRYAAHDVRVDSDNGNPIVDDEKYPIEEDDAYEPSTHDDNEDQQLNAMYQPRPPLQKLSEQDRKDCMSRGLCFRCRQPGHRSNQCPSNNRMAAGNATAGGLNSGISQRFGNQRPAGGMNNAGRTMAPSTFNSGKSSN